MTLPCYIRGERYGDTHVTITTCGNVCATDALSLVDDARRVDREGGYGRRWLQNELVNANASEQAIRHRIYDNAFTREW